jgi:hypothetical protein
MRILRHLARSAACNPHGDRALAQARARGAELTPEGGGVCPLPIS